MKQYRTDPLTEREKRYLRQVRGTKQPFSVDAPAPEIKKVRDYRETIGVKIPRRTRRGFNGCKLSPAIRALIELRRSGRAAFFASLGVKV